MENEADGDGLKVMEVMGSGCEDEDEVVVCGDEDDMDVVVVLVGVMLPFVREEVLIADTVGVVVAVIADAGDDDDVVLVVDMRSIGF